MIHVCDVSTAFLHASLSSDDPTYVWPPKKFYAYGTTLWLLAKAMYGLRTSPKDWQHHFAIVLAAMNFKRLQSDPNVYVLITLQVYILAYVDVLLVVGPGEALRRVLDMLHLKFLLNETDTMNDEG